jgi:hypothetical protein
LKAGETLKEPVDGRILPLVVRARENLTGPANRARARDKAQAYPWRNSARIELLPGETLRVDCDRFTESALALLRTLCRAGTMYGPDDRRGIMATAYAVQQFTRALGQPPYSMLAAVHATILMTALEDLEAGKVPPVLIRRKKAAGRARDKALSRGARDRCRYC